MSLNRSISIEFKFIVDLIKYQHNGDIIKKALASGVTLHSLVSNQYECEEQTTFHDETAARADHL